MLGGPDPTEGLRLSRSESRDLAALRDGLSSAMAAGELGYRYGADVARDILLLRAATGGGRLPAGWEQTVQHGAAARFPVSARDLTPALSGPELGARLRDIEARWIASGFELSREQLLS